ncbi:type I restriction enzyme M protein [Kibdelosporangium banguiense]|uniref:Type I restriction enzyme M protein n=1 Tax=Kibdelosporangium banguiense TaxID=1365924 RepID=A0ABS4T7X5_9PSEU|nr:type I restriction-modification system subunit M/S [Kibdelosporangium banguiense]MBP2320515.1 type I restriction enzyme M protein [Kibdelosporangium banguiense]
MTERGQGLPLSGIAELAGVGVSAASNWRKRHTDFPSPVLVAGQELFSATEVARWLDQRKIARNGLRSDEPPGTTYGDRFRRNGGAPAPPVRSTTPQVHPEGHPDTPAQLWQIMDLLRGDLDQASAADFVMSLLYLRSTSPAVWREVTAQRHWDDVSRLLRSAPVDDLGTPLLVPDGRGHLDGRQWLQVIDLFDQIDLEAAGPATLFDALLNSFHRDFGRRGGHFTPRSLVHFMIEVLDPRESSTVYDPACGSGELLVAAAQRGAASVSGQALNERSQRMSMFNIALHGGKADVRIGGPEVRNGAFTDSQFDIVLANPPFNLPIPDEARVDSWLFGVPPRSDANFAWLQLAVMSLQPGGRAGVLMPNGASFTGGANAQIRRAMVDAGVIAGIIALPAGLFANTGISVSLWLLQRPESGELKRAEILFIDATPGRGETNRDGRRVLHPQLQTRIVQTYRDWRDFGGLWKHDDSGGFCRSVGIAEIQQKDYNLEPQRYVGAGTTSPAATASATFASLQRELDELTSRADAIRSDISMRVAALHDATSERKRNAALGDVCDVQAGPGTMDRERGRFIETWTRLVLPRNIKLGYLSHEDLDTVNPETAARFAKYLLQAGDVVCARSGTLGRHGLVREAETGWLLGPSCMRMRLLPSVNDVDPTYLVHYLNSPETQGWVKGNSHGTAIPNISASTMRKLVIPLPPIAVQREIAAAIDAVDIHIEQHQRAVSAALRLRDVVFPLTGAVISDSMTDPRQAP